MSVCGFGWCLCGMCALVCMRTRVHLCVCMCVWYVHMCAFVWDMCECGVCVWCECLCE